MSYRYQVKDARSALQLKAISGVCQNGGEFISLLNEAIRRLNRRGNFWDTEQLVKLCVYNGCIVWPRYISTVLGVRFCNTSPSEIRNNWFSIIGPHGCFGFRSSHTISDNGVAPCFNEISSGGRLIRLYPTKLEDVGKKVVLYGEDTNDQPLQEKVGGVWQPGLTLVAKAPYGTTTVLIKRISSATKDVTQANMLLYEYDATTNTQRDLALYEPNETNPRYRRSVVHGFDCIPTSCPTSDGVRIRTMEAMVKLEYIELVNDLDFLALDNFDAIGLAIQAIRLEEANQDGAAEGKWIKAIRELNFELRDKTPGQQAQIVIRPLGVGICNPI